MDTSTSPSTAEPIHEVEASNSQPELNVPQAEGGASQPETGAKQQQTEANKCEAEASKSQTEASKSQAEASKSQTEAEDNKHGGVSKEQMEKLLKVAEHERFALETKSEQEKKEMEHKIINLEKDMMSLKGEIIDWQKKCTEKEIQNEMLSGKLQVKGDVAMEKEEMLRVRAEDAEKLLQDFRSDFEKSGDSKSANQKFDMMELRGQLMVQKKKNQALEMNVKSAEMELAAKIKVDAKKTELIDLLDKKLSKQKHEIDYLFQTAQTLIKEKEAQSKKLSSASEELIKLSKRYVDSEKVANEMRRQNNQLKTMLNSLEGKGKKLVGLAKEKVKSYTDENKRLQEEVEDLRQEIDLGRESLGSKVKTLETTLTATCTDILTQVERLVQKENLDDQGKEELGQIQERIRSLEKTKLDVAKTLSESRASEEANINAKLEAKISELSKQNADILAQVESITQEREKLKQEIVTLKGQGSEGDSRDREALLEEIKVKNDEIEKLKGELGAIRALVMKSIDGSGQDENVCLLENEEDVLTMLENVLSHSDRPNRSVRPRYSHNDDDDDDDADDREHAEAEDRVMALLIENAQLKTMVSQTEGALADVEHQLEGQQFVVDDKGNEVLEAKQQIESLLRENTILQSKVSKSSSELSKKDEELADMKNRIVAFEKLLGELKESQEGTVSEKNELLERFREMELKMTDVEDNFVVIVTELTDVKDENLKLIEERDQLVSDLASTESERANLQDTLSSLQSCIEMSEVTFHEMKGSIEELKQDKDKLELALEEMKKMHEEEVSKNVALSQTLEEKVGDFSVQNQLLAQKEKEYESELEQYKTELLQKSQEFEDLKRLLDDFEAEKISLNQKLRSAEDRLASVLLEKNDIEDKAKEFNYQYMTTKSGIEERDVTLADLQQSLEEKEKNRIALLSKLEENEQDKLHLREELEEARSMVRQYEVKPPNLEAVARENDIHQMAPSDGEPSSQAVAVPDIQVENVSLRQQVETLLTSKDEMCRQLIDEKAALEEHTKALIDDLENKGRQFDSLEIQYHSLEEEMRRLQECCDGKSEAIQTLMENMELSRVEMEALRGKVTQMDEVKAKLDGAEKEVTNLKDDMKRKRKEWEKEVDGYEKKVSAVKFQMSASEMEYEETIKKLKMTITDQNQLQSDIDHYEELVDSLNMDLKQLRGENDHQRDELSQLHKDLQNATKENKILARELVTTNGLLCEERSYLEELKQQFNEQTARCDGVTKSLADYKADSRELQKKILKLVKEKDALWQKITWLDHERQLRISDKWMDDSEVDKCLNCSAQFSLVLRKHHCRLCGRIFCHDCCNNWIMTAHSSKEERVCSECLMSNSQLETVTGHRTDDSENSEFLETIEIPKKRSTLWSETSHDSSGDETSSLANVTQITDEKQDDGDDNDDIDKEEEEQDTSTADVDLDEARLLSMTDDNKSGIVTEEASAQSSDDVSHASGRADSDEAYDLITADEVLESLSEPLPDPNLESHSTVTLEQIESGELLCPPELWISAGKMYAVPIFLDRAGVTIHWEFTTKPKGISFSLTYKENEFVTKAQEEVLINLCKCNSHKEPVIGNLTARKPGIYTLLYDNTTSRFTAKKIDFTLKLLTVEAVSCT